MSAGSQPSGSAVPRNAPAGQRGTTLRTRLLLLVATVVLPFVLFACWALADAYRRDHARAAADLLTTVRALSAAPTQVTAVAAGRLRGLAEAGGSILVSGGDAPGGTGGFAALLRRADGAPDKGGSEGELAFYDAAGGLLGASAPVPEAPALAEAVRGVVADGRPTMTALVNGPGGWRLGVLVPAVPRPAPEDAKPAGAPSDPVPPVPEAPASQGRAPVAVLARWLPPAVFSRALQNWNLPDGWVAAVLDRQGVVIGRTRRQDSVVGTPALAPTLAAMRQSRDGIIQNIRNQDDELSTLAFAQGGGFTVVVAVAQTSFDAALMRDVAPAATVALLLLGASLLAGAAMAARLRRVLARVADQARAGSTQPVAARIHEITELSAAIAATARERNQASGALRQQEARYRALVEASSEIVWVADAGGRLLPESGAAWARLTGLPAAVLLRENWLVALHPEDRVVATARWRAALARRQGFEGEWRFLRGAQGAPGDTSPNASGDAAPATAVAAAAPGEEAVGYRWLSVRAVPLITPLGEVQEWVGLSSDITEARRAAVALAESETRLRLAVEGGGLGTWSQDFGGTATLSASAAALLGLPPRQVILPHAQWMIHVPPEDRALLRNTVKALAEGGGDRFAADFRVVRPAAGEAGEGEGGVAWLESRARVLRDEQGRAVRMVGVLRDMSDRVRAAEALRRSEEEFRTLTDAMPQMVWAARPDGFHDYFNRRWYSYTGALPGETDGESWVRLVHPEDRESMMSAWRHSLRTGADYGIEYRFRGADGIYHPFLGQALPLRDEAGRILRWLGTCTDITEIVAARELRANRAAELERLVEERTAALRDSERRLAQAQKMEALGRLAGGVAHDVNNVLQAVLGGARLIGTRSDDPARVQRLAQLVGEQAERGAAVARRLLGFARRGELRAEAIGAEALLRDLREVLGATLGVGVTIDLDVQPGLPPVLADRAQLDTVLVNLAINARDAMPEGGRMVLLADDGTDPPGAAWPGAVPVGANPAGANPVGANPVDAVPAEANPTGVALTEAAETDAAPAGTGSPGANPVGTDPTDAPPTATIPRGAERPAELRRGNFLRLTVRDEGSGMTPEVLARVTEPFFTTKPQGQGTGLGLAMARGFAEQSHGALSVRSAPGRGTMVSLWLPCAHETAAAPVLDEAGPAAPSGEGPETPPPLRILLVDDEDAVRAVLAGVLEEQGHAVTTAASPAEALGCLRSEGGGFDLLVTDLAMPGGADGLSLIEAARRERPGLRALLVTGYADERTAARAAEAERQGPTLLLRKPIDPDALARALGSIHAEFVRAQA
ncbi:PAS domain-containing protein [Roseomonas elaeocarpi]|uniref:histidine kinase n=1 Tax=Roseomonas elaeocarpi TaxID=907779 RepID=A0ABV6JS86_9PROT